MWSWYKPLVLVSSILNQRYLSPRLVSPFSRRREGAAHVRRERGSPKPREWLRFIRILDRHVTRETYQHLPRGWPIRSDGRGPKTGASFRGTLGLARERRRCAEDTAEPKLTNVSAVDNAR